ncbi:FtsK/SpoIIIE family DNA translocase [Mongoliitalea daihaiensis]|uniref:FtsK/SpoIIIE family DNA translocase n=1 Tax=Mongoliitalea daihaiensis TaxID=2782006 RepID=UPI001F391A12|nr:DNA translocase FtsK [Mongoliitalea daihaiensis]UJP65620.1 DNA translocase FtsK [Mongoliitalea daihaiensis]
MASEKPKANTFRKKQENATKGSSKPKREWNLSLFQDKRLPLSIGIFLLSAGIFLLFAFTAHLFSGKADQSLLGPMVDDDLIKTTEQAKNWLGLLGAKVSDIFIRRWFGIGAFFIPPFLVLAGIQLVFRQQLYSLTRYTIFGMFFLIWIGAFLGFMAVLNPSFAFLSEWSGGFGHESGIWLFNLLGWGSLILFIGCLLIFLILFYNIQQIGSLGETEEKTTAEAYAKDKSPAKSPFVSDEELEDEDDDLPELEDINEQEDGLGDDGSSWVIKGAENTPPASTGQLVLNIEDSRAPQEEKQATTKPVEEQRFSVAVKEGEEKTADEVENLDPYDPTLDLPHYKYPTLDLLNEYDFQKVTVTREELEDNKNKIVDTLINFKIGIQEIKATIGPTVTLYEIVPEAGIKISKIKNLEDDIALSLSALGIRIIAPIPGKGTIGIEVPNKNRELVPARAVIGTEKFMKSDKDLPVALGKTISNEVFVMDLAKMPHLLMAGATGQGKSVGLNMILASLVYKKHPSQLKFVLVDPKKVELTLFNKIERHFLAKLPGAEEAIITDTKKVIYTLNSLCIEMDQRYDLLKDAGCRNLKEYNAKFVARRLNPEKGHRFMPYIVLVIDELADLMMTAGKEIEAPIARLAQLARAIGIHLVVATQRPSVNVITGIIKANFPARLSFRVTSKIDSRTILDAGGADQLIGMGDMLLSTGSEMTRLQCAFLDTPEVDAICDWIGEQKGYPDAYLLPEFVGEEGEGNLGDIDLADRDPLFEDAARLIVLHQQGSTSLIQRKLKLGYNRAGRIVDQLEAAGIVGPFEGSKAREVLIQDETSLERLLSSL